MFSVKMPKKKRKKNNCIKVIPFNNNVNVPLFKCEKKHGNFVKATYYICFM